MTIREIIRDEQRRLDGLKAKGRAHAQRRAAVRRFLDQPNPVPPAVPRARPIIIVIEEH